MATISEVKEKRRELELIEEEYLRETPPCQNEKCSWFSVKTSGHCRWSVLLEDCYEYKSESE